MAHLRQVGFWRKKAAPEGEGELPFPTPAPSPGPRPSAWLQRYLTAHALLESYEHGSSSCRLCGIQNGCATLTDGVFVWPEGLWHYVGAHGVALPGDFLQHIAGAAAADCSPQSPGSLAALPLRNHLLYDPAGGEPSRLPPDTLAWLAAHASLDHSGAQ